jgi:hypothetical protein
MTGEKPEVLLESTTALPVKICPGSGPLVVAFLFFAR